ncbi:hypothetical protein Dimus_005443 [Dionaea muscipula]
MPNWQERAMERARVSGGWIPKVQRQPHFRPDAASSPKHKGEYTNFVVDLPEEMNQESLRKFFTNFGVVTDAFKPRKRSKKGTIFGFVPIPLVEKGNGLWFHNKEMLVKPAAFGMTITTKKSEEKGPSTGRKTSWEQKESGTTKAWNGWEKAHFQGKEKTDSYVNVVKGIRAKENEDDMTTIKVRKVANGWLQKSLIATMQDNIDVEDCTSLVIAPGFCNFQMRPCWGKTILLTFSSEEDRD